jgi:hypothetical protein
MVGIITKITQVELAAQVERQELQEPPHQPLLEELAVEGELEEAVALLSLPKLLHQE